MSLRIFPLGVAILASACDRPDPAAAGAQALIARFEHALRAGDRATLREVVTLESRPAIDAMAFDALAGKAPLAVLDAVGKHGAVHVRVRDPNPGGQDGVFIVVPENGVLRVDLVASAGLTAREIPLPGPATRTVVRPLSPAQREHAARLAMQAAPPR